MRTEIFTEAWRLYRMYNVTFSDALSFAWAKYKADKLETSLNLADALGRVETVKAITAELRDLKAKGSIIHDRFKSVNLRVSYVSVGAKHDYMTGKYMGD